MSDVDVVAGVCVRVLVSVDGGGSGPGPWVSPARRPPRRRYSVPQCVCSFAHSVFTRALTERDRAAAFSGSLWGHIGTKSMRNFICFLLIGEKGHLEKRAIHIYRCVKILLLQYQMLFAHEMTMMFALF